MTRCALLASGVATASHARTSSGKPCNRMIGKPWESPLSSKPTFRTGVWTVRVRGAVGRWASTSLGLGPHVTRVGPRPAQRADRNSKLEKISAAVLHEFSLLSNSRVEGKPHDGQRAGVANGDGFRLRGR